jgi:hypothetical protein
MDDRRQPVTRLGPDSGGRAPGETGRGPGETGRGGNPGDPALRFYRWEWGPDEARRPGLPWIGIFLLVFGALLLIQQLNPEFRSVGSVIVLAIGLAFVVQWAIGRGTGSLYAGAIITALAVPGLLNSAGIEASGLTTFSLGVAFLFIAAVRAVSGGGIGWQAWFGGLLALVGAASIAGASYAALLLPILLVGLGILLILRGTPRGGRWR